MRVLVVLLIVLCGISCAHGFLDFLFGGGDSKPVEASSGECKWKQKDRGVIGSAVDTVGGAVGGLIGGVWGALAPTGANKGAIEAAGGGDTGKGGGLIDGVTGLAGGGVGGIWGAVVPNSVRCGSIEGAKTTGNVGTTNRKDPSCENYHWVDDNGNECTPTDDDHANDGHTDDNIETITHTLTLNYKSKAEGEKLINTILLRWKQILAKYGVNGKDVAIVIYEDNADGNVHTVTYTIKFKRSSGKEYDIDTIIAEFENDLKKKPIKGVTISGSGDDGHTAHINTGISGSKKTETITHTLTLNYKNKAEGDKLINTILARWRIILAKYGVASKDVSIKITTDKVSGNVHTVTYVITFKISSGKKYTLETITSEFENDLKKKTITGVTITVSGDDDHTDAGHTDGDSNTGDDSNTGGDSHTGGDTGSDTGSITGGNTGSKTQTITHTLTLNYKSKADGDKIINTILARWKIILAKYGVASKDVSIKISNDKVSGNVHIVTYIITFKISSGKKWTVDTITSEFENDLKKKAIAGVTITVTISGSGDNGDSGDHSETGTGSVTETTEHVTSVGGEEISTPVITQTGSKFSVTGTLTMVYESDSQREAALNKILTIWVAVLKQYQVSKATITVTSVHRTDNSTPTEISYTVTGTAIKHIDFAAAQQTFLARAKATNF